ncbi:hypothetical protein D3C76_784920 [compost metagenome]
MVLVFDGPAERIGLFDQAGEIVVLEGQLIAIGQRNANQISSFIQVNGVALAAVIAAGNTPTVFVVMHFQFTPQHINSPGRALFEVVAEVKMLAVAGPVFDHARLLINGFPTVMTAQAQSVAVAGHQVFGVAETTHRIAVAVDHFAQLAVVVVTILD